MDENRVARSGCPQEPSAAAPAGIGKPQPSTSIRPPPVAGVKVKARKFSDIKIKNGAVAAKPVYDVERKQNDAREKRRRRIGYLGGIVGFAAMCLLGVLSTLTPRPDGRHLNTAPALGVDVFLFVGLLGMGYCLFKLRKSKASQKCGE